VSKRVDYARFREVYDATVLSGDFLEDRAYYHHYRERYWRTLGFIDDALPEPSRARLLDIGSGQFALLCRKLFGAHCDVADIDSRHVDVLKRNDVGFVQVDLTSGGVPAREPYDVIVMAEVIEHVPRPPHLVFADLRPAIVPGGRLILTTPNLYRLRNVVRLATGQRVFDTFRLPARDRPLGHFLEYDRKQLSWHLHEAGFEIEVAAIEQLDHGGASLPARLARQILRPVLAVRPLWRDNLVFVARRV
jgi:2-polyprenyl-3-methyl-5-hydroxy-6-metoxy-1,4-benzoquinol methylase